MLARISDRYAAKAAQYRYVKTEYVNATHNVERQLLCLGYCMLKVLKNTLRAPAGSNGPRLPRKTERSLACLACNDAHCVCLLSYAAAGAPDVYRYVLGEHK